MQGGGDSHGGVAGLWGGAGQEGGGMRGLPLSDENSVSVFSLCRFAETDRINWPEERGHRRGEGRKGWGGEHVHSGVEG